MRIIHTADWHLNDRLGRIDRTADLRAAVERVAAHCVEAKADCLVVAGDLFSELARPDALRETIRHWQDVFAPFLAGGGTILAITGNHDNENFCQTLTHAMTLAAPTGRQPGARVAPGRLYLAADPVLVKLRDRSDRYDVQFVLMPFPTPTRYLTGAAAEKYANPSEKNTVLTQAFNQTLTSLRTGPEFDPTSPAVLSAHVHVHGSQIGASLFRLAEQDDIVVGGERFAHDFAYAALGHIHRPQYLGATNVRYSGTIERMDLGEAANQLGVVLVDVGPDGLSGEPVILPLPGTSIYEIQVMNPEDDIPRLKEEYAGAANDLVNLHVHYTAGEHNLEAILRDLDRLFPRWYARDWRETGTLGPTLVGGPADSTKSFRDTVVDYLSQELVQHTDADRQGLLNLADELLAEGE